MVWYRACNIHPIHRTFLYRLSSSAVGPSPASAATSALRSACSFLMELHGIIPSTHTGAIYL